MEVVINDKITGKIISGAKVEVYSDKNEIVATEITDEKGSIVVTGLQPGKFTINVVFVPNGYSIPESKTIEFVLGSTSKINFEVLSDEEVIGDTVDTGDHSTVIPYVILIIVCMVSIVAVSYKKKIRNL